MSEILECLALDREIREPQYKHVSDHVDGIQAQLPFE